MIKHILTCISFLLLTATVVSAQSVTFQPRQLNTENKGLVYEKEMAFNLRLHTYGWAIGLDIGQIRTYYKTRFYTFEIGELKHPKERRHSFDYPNQFSGRTSRAFIFGKQNNFYVLRGGIGVKRYFSEKAKRKGVAVGISYQGGPALGLIKPYYVDFIRPVSGTNQVSIVSMKYNGSNYDEFTDVNRIYGATGFSKGLSEISLTPGLHGKISAHFDWGAFDEFVKAFEAGIMVDVFFREIPLMVDNANSAENRPFFINLYLTLQLGKRW